MLCGSIGNYSTALYPKRHYVSYNQAFVEHAKPQIMLFNVKVLAPPPIPAPRFIRLRCVEPQDAPIPTIKLEGPRLPVVAPASGRVNKRHQSAGAGQLPPDQVTGLASLVGAPGRAFAL